jgi:hypothetical protein
MIIPLGWQLSNRMDLSPSVGFKRVAENITESVYSIPSSEDVELSLNEIA